MGAAHSVCEQEVGSKVDSLPIFGLWAASGGSLEFASSTCSGLVLAAHVLNVLACSNKEPLLFRNCGGAFSEVQATHGHFFHCLLEAHI